MKNSDDLSREPREQRQAHLDLTTPCVVRGGNSNHYEGILAEFLNTTIPREGLTLVCHACGHLRCSNPEHMYWHRDPYHMTGLDS
jgi:hypothetical protein